MFAKLSIHNIIKFLTQHHQVFIKTNKQVLHLTTVALKNIQKWGCVHNSIRNQVSFVMEFYCAEVCEVAAQSRAYL